MNDLQERMANLLDEPWLEGEVAVIEDRARALRSRQRRVVVAGVLVLGLVLGTGAVVAGRPDHGDGRTSLDVAGVPAPVYVRADAQVVLYLPPEASLADRDGVRTALTADPAVGQAWAVSQEDAYAEFRCLFIDELALIESVTPAILPTSFDVALVAGADVAAFEARMRTFAVVREVIVEPTAADIEATGTSVPWRPDQDPQCDGSPRGGDPIK